MIKLSKLTFQFDSYFDDDLLINDKIEVINYFL